MLFPGWEVRIVKNSVIEVLKTLPEAAPPSRQITYIFYLRNSRCSQVVYFVYHCQPLTKLILQHSDKRRIRLFCLSFCFAEDGKKCTKNYNARAQPLLRLFNKPLVQRRSVAMAFVVFLIKLPTYIIIRYA